MKKKILVVFLICCMFLGVASPAMAFSLPDQYDTDIPPIPEGYETYDYLMLYDNSSNEILTMFYKNCNLVFAPYYKNSLYNGIYLTDVIFSSSYVEAQYMIDSNSWEDSFWVCPEDRLADNSCMLQLGKGRYFYVAASAPFYLADDYEDRSTYEVFHPAPLPLPELAEVLIQKTPAALDLDGKMKILVPFGISCLALLISLPLLSKVLRRFLN